MVGVKLKYTGRLSASSIVEVLVAMIVILIVFGTAMMISVNVMRSSQSTQKIQAVAILHDLMIVADQNKTNESQTLSVEDFLVKEEVKNYNDDPGLIEIHLTAYDNNSNNVAELQKIIVNK